MKRRTLHLCLLSLLFAGLMSADLFYSPLAGYVTDASGSQLWPILGVPGSFSFGGPLSLPGGVSQIRLAPRQEYALATVGQDATGILYLKAGAIDRVATIDGAMGSADWIVFSPSARSAMLFSAGAHRLQVLKGLPDAPHVESEVDSSTLPEQPTMGAVTDEGSLVLVASGTSVYRLAGDGTAKMVLSAGGVQSLTVLRNGTDAAVSDSTTGAIYVVENAATNPELRMLSPGLDGIGAIFPSGDGKALFAAQAGASSVSSIDLMSGEVRSFPAFVAPTGLAPLRNDDTFLISAKALEPGWIFYLDGMVGRVAFIPAAQAARETPVKGDEQ